MKTTTITYEAADPSGRMTLDDLEGFVKEARDAGFLPGTQVRVRTRYTGHLRSITAKGDE